MDRELTQEELELLEALPEDPDALAEKTDGEVVEVEYGNV